MTLYLTPGAAQDGNYINFYYTKRIDDVGAYTNATDVPYRFVPCMIAGLSYYLAVKYAPQRVQELKLLYEDELLRAEDEDGSSNSTYISPKIYYPGIGLMGVFSQGKYALAISDRSGMAFSIQ